MVELGGCLSLALKSLNMLGAIDQRCGHDFDRDAATKRLMNRFKDDPHSASTDLANDRVTPDLVELGDLIKTGTLIGWLT